VRHAFTGCINSFVTYRVECGLLRRCTRWSAKSCHEQAATSAAPRVDIGRRKYDRDLTTLIHEELHWLDVPDRVTYKLVLMMHRCLHGKAPKYLVDCCTPVVSDVVGPHRLRSASRLQFVVLRHRLTTLGPRAFAVIGATVWNSLPDDLLAQQNNDCFCRFSKTFLS